MSLLNITSFFYLVDDFVYLNQIVNSISEQINLFKRQSSVCVCVSVRKLRKLLVYYVMFGF